MNKDKFNVMIPMNPFTGQGSRYIKNVKEIVDNFKLSLEGVDVVNILDKINLPNFNPDYKDENGDPILHLLINDRYLLEDNKLFILKYLIAEKKADFTIKNRKFQNILHLSLKHGLYKIVDYLLDNYINRLNCYDIDGNNYLNYLVDVIPLEDNELKFNNKDNYIDKTYDEEKEKIIIQLIEICNNEYKLINNQKVTNIKKIIEIINDNFVIKKIGNDDIIFFKDPLFNYSINLFVFYDNIIEKILNNNKLDILKYTNILNGNEAIDENIYNKYKSNIQNIINEINKYIDVSLNEVPDKNIIYYDLSKHEYKIDYIKYDDHKNFNTKIYKELIKDIIRKLKVNFYNNMLNGIKFGEDVKYYNKTDIKTINNFSTKNEYVNYLYKNYNQFVNTIKNIKDVFHIDNNIKIYNDINDYNKEKEKDNIFYNLIKLVDIIIDDNTLDEYNKKILDNYKIFFNINDSKLIINNYTNYLIIQFFENILKELEKKQDKLLRKNNSMIKEKKLSRRNSIGGSYFDIYDETININNVEKKISELNNLIKLMFDKDGIIDLINKRSNNKITSYNDIKKILLVNINNCTDNIFYSNNYLKKNNIIIIKKDVNEENIITKITNQKFVTNNNFINSILNHNKYNYNIIKKIDYKKIIIFDKQKVELKNKIQSKITFKETQLKDIKEIYKNNFTKNKYVEEAIEIIDKYNIVDESINNDCIYELYIFKYLYANIINFAHNNNFVTYLEKENKIKKDNDNAYNDCDINNIEIFTNNINIYNKYRLIKRKGYYEDYDNFKMNNIELFNNDGDVILFNSFFENSTEEYNDVISNVKKSYDKYIDDVIDIYSDLYEINMNLLTSIKNDQDLINYLSK